MVVEKCPLCQSTNFRPFDVPHPVKKVPDYMICECGMVFQEETMEPKHLLSFYQKGYRTKTHGSEMPNQGQANEQTHRAARLMMFIGDRLDDLETLSNHLDVGCSLGVLLLTFKKVYGTYPIGIEPTITHREFCMQKGLTTAPTLDKAPDMPYSVITAIHTVEHLPNPLRTLRELWDVAEDGARLLIEVPNLYGSRFSLWPHHTVAFSKKTLSAMVEAAGWEVQEVRTAHWYDPLRNPEDIQLFATRKHGYHNTGLRDLSRPRFPELKYRTSMLRAAWSRKVNVVRDKLKEIIDVIKN